ncbi:LysR family transcriptional regulator [Flavicella marina]|uniref:LysR family transcriptional regulator n=1 Tax=Flavicella marina TaxID=1475951 RepID=UPI0012653D65|nr:LysR family transcriptional regulator [Flavicella marina]
MNYTLNQLQIFLKIAQTKSVTKASEELHLTQPAVSIQLKNFQAQFDLPLTEVIGRKIYITDFGKEIAKTAEIILEGVEKIKAKNLAFQGKVYGKLTISIVSTAKYVMPYFLARFMRTFPDVELEMHVTNKSSVVSDLENNLVDFSLVSLMPDTINLERFDLLGNRLYLVVKPGLEIPKTNDAKKILEQLPLLYRELGSATRLSMEKYIKTKNISIAKKIELTSNEAIKQAVLAGMGCSIMPLIGIKDELLHGSLNIVPLEGLPIETQWSLVWPSGKKHSPVVEKYLEFLSEEKDRIIKNHFSWHEAY